MQIPLLAAYLKRAGVVSGPTKRLTRHSELSVFKNYLFGIPHKGGYKAHNNFGSALHSRFLLRRAGKYKLLPAEKIMIECMMTALDSHAVVNKLMRDRSCMIVEKRRRTNLNGVALGYTPDAYHTVKKYGVDLKTTACANFAAFLTSCFKYGYVRQAVTYSKALGLKEFYIIGIEKSVRNPQVYIVVVSEYKDKMKYYEAELSFLLYFYKNYGKIKKLIQ